MAQFAAPILAAVVLSGCTDAPETDVKPSPYSTRSNFVLEVKSTAEFLNRFKSGMSTNEVIDMLGAPSSTDHDGAGEWWTYPIRSFPADDSMRGSWVDGAHVWFTNGRVDHVSFVYRGAETENKQTETLSEPLAEIRFYIVFESPVEGGRFIDTPELPRVGYIKRIPDLAFQNWKSVTVSEQLITDSERIQSTNWSFAFTLTDESAPKFEAFTETNVLKRILITAGNEPLAAPKIVSPIAGGNFEISVGDRERTERLKRLLVVQSKPQH